LFSEKYLKSNSNHTPKYNISLLVKKKKKKKKKNEEEEK
jgi:hypothetical protein